MYMREEGCMNMCQVEMGGRGKREGIMWVTIVQYGNLLCKKYQKCKLWEIL